MGAVLADARLFAAHRGERFEFRNRIDALARAVRLAAVSDAFLGLVCYRLQAWARGRGIPALPVLAHQLARWFGSVCIGDPVTVEPGIYLPHGQVVIDGFVEIGRGTVIAPFVTVGLVAGNLSGATIGRRVQIGTGAKILGPVRIGAGAAIGANAVVVDDVPDGATAVGVPARVVGAGG